MKRRTRENKPIIETLINTTALTLTSVGVVDITAGNYKGYAMVLFGMCLEFIKYLGRQRKLW